MISDLLFNKFLSESSDISSFSVRHRLQQILYKQILDQINSKLCEILKVNEWKNTENVINWFKKVESENSHKFSMFDIKDFYPSIKEDLLIETFEFAKQHVTIKSKDRETIFHARKSLLHNEGEPWIKKQTNNLDVTMGSYDGAEVCELIFLSDYTEMTDWQFLKIQAAPNLKKLKRLFKECLRTKV